jgi:hypothetical protein
MRDMRRSASLAALAALTIVNVAHADDTKPTPDKSAYSLLDPTPDPMLRDLASDRPTKSFSPITVDAGHFQIEMDLANYAFGTYAGVTTQTFLTADPVIKLGLVSNIDLEIQIGGYQSVKTLNAATHATLAYGDGFGDVMIKTKINFVGDDGGTFALAMAPFVKIPSSTPLVSNGRAEAGVQFPLLVNLPHDFTLISTPEFDLLKNANDFESQAGFRVPVGLAHAVPGIDKLTAYVEFYSAFGTDRFTPPVYTLDLGLGYLLTPNCQLDAAVDIGLNNAAPALQVFAGMTQRF